MRDSSSDALLPLGSSFSTCRLPDSEPGESPKQMASTVRCPRTIGPKMDNQNAHNSLKPSTPKP